MEPLLDVHQVAAIMSIHVKKVQRLARTGVLPCIKVGAVYRFRAATLEAWIGEHEVSKRKSTKEDTQGGQPSLGVPLQDIRWHDAPEDAIGVRLSLTSVGEDPAPGSSFYIKRP